MIENEEIDCYSELYRAAKFTTDELRKYLVCQHLTEEELEEMSDLLFDIGIIAQKLMIENYE